MVPKIIDFIKVDIWRIRLSKITGIKSFLIKQLRIIILALRGFDEDKCSLRASALTFYSLLSIVPVAAMAFGIAKGFGFEKVLEKQIIEKFQGQQEIMAQIINFSRSLLENTKGGMIAGIGVILLFWIVIKVLGNVENAFNNIWGIRKSRNIGRKFSDYLSVMLICPVLFIASSSITMAITGRVEDVVTRVAFLGVVSPAIFATLKLLPYFVICILFAFVYIFMPNTKVNFKSGILAGISAGIIYQLVQWGYINFQIGVAKYNAIYGSFAALPLFLVWLQMSWLIVLFGAEISFAHQNVETYEFEPDCLRISHSFKNLLSLRIMHLLVKSFYDSKKPYSASEISHTLEIPIRLVRQILYELVDAGIVSEVKEDQDKSVAFQPARNVDTITIKKVIDALEDRGTHNIPVVKTDELDKISECLDAFGDTLKKSPANVALKNI